MFSRSLKVAKFSKGVSLGTEQGELLRRRTLAGTEEVVSERKGDETTQGQNEEREELTLQNKKKSRVSTEVPTGIMPAVVSLSLLPVHHKCNLTTCCGKFMATAGCRRGVFKDREGARL